MITNHISQLNYYKKLSENISTAIDFVLKTDFSILEKGKYEIKSDEIFAIVNEFQTFEIKECIAESHRKYIDLQIIIKGNEKFGFDTLTNQKAVIHNEESDVYFYKNKMPNFIELKENEFIFFFTFDIHQPEICIGEPSDVKKVVVKIKNDFSNNSEIDTAFEIKN